MRKVIDTDPTTGISHVFYFDDATDEVTITAEQEVAGVLEHNKRAFNDAPERYGEWTRVAQIPLSIYYDMVKTGKIRDDAYMKRWLNDPDNRFFRTRPGVV